MVYKNNNILAVIPARGGSKGLPGKNIITLAGKPLIAWTLEVALASKYIDKIFVSTDSLEIANVVKEYVVDVPFLRPAELATDTATTYSVVKHVLNYYENINQSFDYLILLEPTSPLREVKDVDEAIELLLDNRDKADSVVSISEVIATHPFFDVMMDKQGRLLPYTQDFSGMMRRQDIPKLYFLEGTIYASDTKEYLARKGFCHDRTLGFIVPKWKSFEVDDMVDLFCIENILKNIENIKRKEGMSYG